MTEQPTNANTNQIIAFDGKHEAAAAALALVESAQREICFLGSQLDSTLLDNLTIIECIKQLCISSRRSKIRFLVDETQSSIISSHRLLPLISKLTSSISVHILSDKHQRPKNIVLLVDDSGYLRCLNNQRYLGQVNLHDPLTVRELKQQFEECWNHSSADVATRRFLL
jgi:glycosylphosphatidylinositol transamidase (GPIT) subunit GPI8